MSSYIIETSAQSTAIADHIIKAKGLDDSGRHPLSREAAADLADEFGDRLIRAGAFYGQVVNSLVFLTGPDSGYSVDRPLR